MLKTLLVSALAAGALWWPRPVTAARVEGQDGAASAQDSAAPSLPGEWMYPRSSRDVLAAVRATLSAAGLRLQHDERALGALVTRPSPYDPSRWLEVGALALPAGHTPTTVQFHIHVSPDLEPARIAVGAVLDTAVVQTPMKGARAHGGGRFYSQRLLAARFAEALSAQLGVDPEPLAGTSVARSAQARRLLPLGLDGGCGVRPPSSLAGHVAEQMPRRTTYAVQPVYPDEQQQSGAGGRITIAAEVTEHGTVVAMTTESDKIGDGNLKAAAFGAAGLWRYKSAVVGGCPVPVLVILGIEFTMQRR